MELFTKILSFIKTQKTWLKSLAVIIVTLISVLLIFSSCGTTHASVKIKNPKDNPVVNLSITTNNPTAVEVTPAVKLDSTNISIK